ncbi:acetyl-CoA synthetase-like protein [Moesziomyces antarcticus]|uniref:Acetyl-CoA synthetase-like protein n=2 Tax=Pseudozyma antarctica TaxID=84753 RepID=A0A081CKF3_PSEA2|nr:acetyl-CoA synthetase-like protein [Moesziomyces antarcticus]GAK67149.1 acetyl-CoA synthetase-like protein [Moesziomyces antarcticus]SPO48405.1 related to Long-chain-fatty-acid--CoA ligase 6 [Moesziomyces antarcticus]
MTTDLPPEVHFPLDKQMLPVPGSKQPGFSSIYKSAALAEYSTNCTVYETLLRAKDENLKSDVAGWRPWNPVTKDFEKHFEWYTHEEVEEERTAIGSGIGALARQGRLGDGVGQTEFTVGIWTLNRPEFMIIDYSNIAYSRRTVSLYETYDAASAQYIIDHAETRILFTTPNHVGVVLAAAQAGKLPLLKAIVILDSFRPSKQAVKAAVLDPQRDTLAKEWAKTCGIEIFNWFEILDLGRNNIAAHIPPNVDSIHSFCYTSGTTGNPKAAIITAGMGGYVSTAMAFHKRGAYTLISYLPTAHIYARLCEIVAVRTGGSIGYFCGDTTRLLEDMAILKPQMFPSVPRVLNRIAALVQAQAAAPGLKGALLRKALAAKIANHDRDGTLTHALYDRLIFSKVQALLGGRVEYIVSGSAPIRGDVLKLLRVVLACDVREGYGQTENYGFCTIMSPNDISLGSVGAIYPGMQLKLRDVPDMGYTSDDKPFPRGELLCKSQCTFPGYYKDEAKTKETLTDDGFLRTGDIAAIDQFGRVRIVDRVKSLLKLSQGEYVAIDNLSEFYGQNPLAAQLVVHGDSFRDYLIGISVPEPTTFAPMVSKLLGRQIAAENIAALEEACKDERVVNAYLDAYTKIARQNNLKGYEYIKGLHLRMEPFSVENGLLTPTFKVKRHEAVKHFKDQIEAVYAKGPINVSSGRAKL